MINAVLNEIKEFDMLLNDSSNNKKNQNFFNCSKVFPEFYTIELFLYFKRIDIFRHFNLFDLEDRVNFFNWVKSYGLSEINRESFLGEYLKLRSDDNRKFINLVCDFSSISGISTSGKQLSKVLNYYAEDLRTYDVPNLINNKLNQDLPEFANVNKKAMNLDSNKNIFVFNGDQMQNLFHHIMKGRNKSINIGYWAWELETLHEDWLPGFDYIDEIWAVSKFCSNTFNKYTDKDVSVVPIAISSDLIKTNNAVQSMSLLDFFKTDKSYILTIIDFRSCVIRKNLMDTLKLFESYKLSEQGDLLLVVKVINCTSISQITDLIKIHAPSYSDQIKIISESLRLEDFNLLIKNCKALISLHRSEGFGISLAVAMLMGTPVIATGYSGNLEFMNDDNSFLVDYDLIKIDKEAFPIYQIKGATWAQPNLINAQELLLKIIHDKKMTTKRVTNAIKHISTEFNQAKIFSKIKRESL